MSKHIKSILMKRPTESDYGHDLESLILDTLTCGFIEFSKTSLIREVAISNHFMTCLRHASAIGFGISKHESFKVFNKIFVRPIESIDVQSDRSTDRFENYPKLKRSFCASIFQRNSGGEITPSDQSL